MKNFLFGIMVFFCGFSTYADTLYWGASGQKPLEVAIDFLRNELPEGDSEGLQKVVLEQTNLSCLESKPCYKPMQIVLEVHDLADDSVKAIRYRLVLEQQQSQPWQVISKEEQFLCRAGRGQADFSNKQCL
ncbi:hypothetical protein [Neisseria sp. Ec49-e6-T10]|uniref:hypothetical protein n=1 Tax=Neisseria sp. Ec49-e6-T10 TaxID=3140744 RepID=UPI003EB75F98